MSKASIGARPPPMSRASRNYMGVRSAAVDAMIEAMLAAPDARDDFVAAVRALDRVLVSGCYVVPLFYLSEQWVARWTFVAHPAAHRSSATCRKRGGVSRNGRCNDPRRSRSSSGSRRHAARSASARRDFRRLAERRPDALALADPPNREKLHRRRPRRLTYAEADRMVSAMAGRLRRHGTADRYGRRRAVAEHRREFFGDACRLRAGMIVAAAALLCRRADAAAALARVGAKAMITCGRVGDFDHAQCAMRVAADVFAIRYVCGFGENLPDGVVPFDDLFTADKLDSCPARGRPARPTPRRTSRRSPST